MTGEPDFEALAEWAESDEPTIRPGAAMHRGTPERHAAMLALLEAAAETPGEKALIDRARRGRPPLDPRATPGTTSPMWRVRAPEALNAAARARAASEGRDLSALVRDAVQAYLAAS